MSPFLGAYDSNFFIMVSSILEPYASERLRCAICMDTEPQILFLPCGHHNMCKSCVNEMQTRKQDAPCPFCKTKINITKELTRKNNLLCEHCKAVAPNIFYDCCGRFSSCDNCDKTKICMTCGADPAPKIKVFSN